MGSLNVETMKVYVRFISFSTRFVIQGGSRGKYFAERGKFCLGHFRGALGRTPAF